MSARRLALDEPYVASNRSLLAAFAEANDVRCVFHVDVDLATLVGPAGQLAHVEMLFTSLLRSSARFDRIGEQAGATAADRAALRERGLDGSPARHIVELPDAS